MASSVGTEAKIEFLRRSSAEDVVHTGRPFLEHLVGTRDLLASWGARPAVVDAGLFHSVYGTEEFRTSLLPDTARDEVRSLIGDDAEEIAWLWCVIRRWTLVENLAADGSSRAHDRRNDVWLDLSPDRVTDVADLWIADTVEQAPFMPASYVNYAQKLLPLGPRANPRATRGLEELIQSSG